MCFETILVLERRRGNGRAAAPAKRISPHQVYNALDFARTLFNWATNPRIGKLPTSFVNPFDAEIVGQRPNKDPLRAPKFPIDRRVDLVSQMDEWQLSHLTLSLLLPLRPEDCSGLLIRDVDFANKMLKFGFRFGGRDFNKGKVSFAVPFPAEILPVLVFCRHDRDDGPLLRSRSVFEERRSPKRPVGSSQDIDNHLDQSFRLASTKDVRSPQDRKLLLRKTIREMGGVNQNELSQEFTRVARRAGVNGEFRFYDLRESITTDLDRTGVSHLVKRYVTGHATSDILNTYTCLDPATEMTKYFTSVTPLVDAILTRAQQLGLRLRVQ